MELSNHQRGTVYGIRGTNTDGDKSYVLDTDNDHRFDDETIQPSVDTTSQTVHYIADDDSKSETSIEIFSEKARDEYSFRDFWKTTLQVGQESLPVGIAFVEPGKYLMFGDADQDGRFDDFIAVEQELALGGKFWKTEIDMGAQADSIAPRNGQVYDGWCNCPQSFNLIQTSIPKSQPCMCFAIASVPGA